ncbi:MULTISPECIES: Eco57I restriction-modification methylase domain-containing protein [Streptomyces]|uniref:site-specific DNA-methyltransferase (adenine-specific) n=2 Tax=Streptomyces TaxID=1883 RepID=A0A3M8F2E3_9ACTN|nr:MULTISPECIES: DNA methyltransferase [Streptomyces]KNE82412.1 Type II restriction enzyme, methylase subunits [Streptomyces fradiae]OFA52495.1 type II restriction endonuclease subunit M [Streptomyces fradiae]PQM19674.1 class I SAM-dependent DNA methyltransferase [Streptomyces xinghaiensis]RKM91031.1 class I SAM-dependent DNA methyltransferase [Streptomyces xinghaiensis]RNC72355.1 class I SAM-dependent DNA methyltransferase [Streptomyces xinghaiensis]
MSRRYPPTAAHLHRAWLELVDTDGPFLAVPALERVYPQGIPQPDSRALDAIKDAKPAFEKAWENWDEHPGDEAALDLYREARNTWVDLVLRQGLRWGASYTVPAPAAAEVRSPDYAVTVRADGALVHGDTTGALVLVTDPTDSLRDPLTDGWSASPIDRMEELLRASGVPIGVVTDGRWWAIVSARPQTMVASGIVDAQTWIEEPQTRNAFIELLQRRRLVGGKQQDRLTELFGESVTAAEKITEALGTQVRRAVELIVQALSEGALDAQRRGEPDPLPAARGEVYEAAVTVMMRVVFLLFAEERGLLPQSRLFAMGYGISDELDLLDAREKEEGEQALDATFLTWHRLLATSQALYRGASFEDLRLPEYGGSLFDPARFPFLTACDSQDTLAITVSDRVMLEVLRAVQIAQLPGGARRISFRDIDVEQIGYIYEGLLGYSCEPVEEVIVGLTGGAGSEPEIPLATLEELSQAKPTETALADAILAWIKQHQPAAKPPSKAALTKALKAGDTLDDTDIALLDVTDDPELRDRLRPFIGIIRRDLRNRPLVVEPGGVLLVETPSRASSGAHYTPRSLAEEVVRYALEPLVYSPGPHQTADQDTWRPIDSDQILDLRVADIACGSGAFLVGAARYLADRLVEAWQREGVAYGRTPHDLHVHAIRTVVATCLYGADINGMAVEMCKLSLWLVSLDPKLPFSFVDDKVLHGNALLGLTDADQLRRLHIDPAAAGNQFSIFALDVDDILDQASRLRRQLATEVDDNDPQRSAATKRRQWRRYQELTAQLADVADGVVAAGLRWGAKPSKQLKAAYEDLRIAVESAYPAGGGETDRVMLDDIKGAGLTPTVTTDYERWKPLHWILAVPDVMERGGFDAVIGNPPFLGGSKITGSMGTNIRDWLVSVLANGKKGNGDLAAYFFLRAYTMLTRRGVLGLIATNTIAQGDTRQVGLDQLAMAKFTITRAIQSRSWPAASANLEYAAVWGTRAVVNSAATRVVAEGEEDVEVTRISTLLEAGGRVGGTPYPLAENEGIAYNGCKVDGLGFVLNPKEAEAWIEASPANARVLYPYLNGENLNSRPDASPARWIIDFTGMSEEQAKMYELPYQRVLERVKPVRATNNRKVRRERWWLFAEQAPGMREAIRHLDKVLVIALTSKSVVPLQVPAGQVFSHMLGVFATDSFADQAVLSSSLHQTWAIKYGSGMRNDPRYTPSDVFGTFPRPRLADGLTDVGSTLDTNRREIMLRRNLGLTKLYNLVNDPTIADSADPDVARLREIHVELDQAVMAAYGWDDVPLDHGFHTYRQMQRWTVSPAARVEILDRLLEENHRRAASQGVVSPASNNEATEDEEGDE